MIPSWMEVAITELADHVAESPGALSGTRIVEYHSVTRGGASPDQVPWCSSFACWCLEKSDVQSTRSKAARSWLYWENGVTVDQPVFGDVTVLWRGDPRSAAGHVGFFLVARKSQVALLSGNVRDRVSVDWWPAARLLGFRRPRAMGAVIS